jgi:hypothetical protein
MTTEHYTQTIRRLEHEQKHLRRDIARYRKLTRRYEVWLKERVLGGKHVSPR